MQGPTFLQNKRKLKQRIEGWRRGRKNCSTLSPYTALDAILVEARNRVDVEHLGTMFNMLRGFYTRMSLAI